MSQVDNLVYLANLYQNSSALESSVVNKDKWGTAQNIVNELSAAVSLPINSNNVVASSYLIGIVSNAFAASDLAGKLSKGEATSKDILNFSLGIDGTLASAGILISGGVAATAASPLVLAATLIGISGIVINSDKGEEYLQELTNFLSDPAVVDSVHQAFENAGSFDVTYAPELNISPKMINELHMSVADQINLFGAINPNITPEMINKMNETLSGGGIPQSIIPNYTPTQYDPITLDLDGDGIETVGLNAGVLFDHNGDGIQTGTGWVGKDDGLLVLDKNNNGTIDNGAELFGDNTLLRNGQKAKDGFAAISDLDLNQDGKLNSSDAAFANLRVWQDANQDGFSQATELKTLNELGISSINTSASITGGQNQNNGNVIIGSSSFEREDGSTNTSGALNFTGNTFTREFSDVIDTSAVAGLPDMRASGTVRDLREAAALSSDLATKLQTYAESNTRNSAGLDVLLSSWASTSDMQTLASTLKPGGHPAGGRGTNLNQSEIDKLNVLEKFTGLYGGISNFSDPMDGYDGVANGRYSGTFYGINLNADMINKSYALLSKSVDSAISVQTDLKDEMNEVMFKFSADGVTLDMSNVYAKVTSDNASRVLNDVINLYTYFKDNAGELFPATSQLATLSWIKDRMVNDGITPAGLNEIFWQFGNATTGDDFIITANKSSTIAAGDGNDQVYGLGGNDAIYTGIQRLQLVNLCA